MDKPRQFIALTFAALLVSVPVAPVIAQRPASVGADPGSAAALALFDQVWEAIREYYYDPAFNGADWTAIRARYRPLAAEVRDEDALRRLLRAMLGELRDAHTRLLDPRQAREREEGERTSTGVILYEVGGQPIVFDVRPDSPAAEARVRIGQRVLTVNGVPVRQALAAAHAEIGPSSSDRAARVLAYLRLVAGKPGEMLHLQLADRSGAQSKVSLGRRPLSVAPRFESRRLVSGDLYVRFDRFRKPVARRLRETLQANRDARGLVLDLRSNTGGDGEEGLDAIGPLLAAPVVVARLATRTGKPPSALGGLITMPMVMKAGRQGRQSYAGPVVILINEGTGSTSEVIAGSLQEQGRAKVVGTRSCGCALGVLKYRKLRDGSALAISEVGLLSGHGRRIEGAGVAPDVLVEPALSDIDEGRDGALAAAVTLLASMRK